MIRAKTLAVRNNLIRPKYSLFTRISFMSDEKNDLFLNGNEIVSIQSYLKQIGFRQKIQLNLSLNIH